MTQQSPSTTTHPPAGQADAETAVELLAAAAAGLTARDQLLLELTVRRGLSGRELAERLGVSVQQGYCLAHRMRQRIARSMAALTVARHGRQDCGALARMLRDWDGRFTVLTRKRVARHIDRCPICDRTRATWAASYAPELAVGPDAGREY